MGTRDKLALERSKLANERTLLSFMRTAVMFFATGATMLKLFYSDTVIATIGTLLVVSSFVLGGYGLYFYQVTKRHLRVSNFVKTRKNSFIGRELN